MFSTYSKWWWSFIAWYSLCLSNSVALNTYAYAYVWQRLSSHFYIIQFRLQTCCWKLVCSSILLVNLMDYSRTFALNLMHLFYFVRYTSHYQRFPYINGNQFNVWLPIKSYNKRAQQKTNIAAKWNGSLHYKC